MVIWALFDSGNGCYKRAIEKIYVNAVKGGNNGDLYTRSGSLY